MFFPSLLLLAVKWFKNNRSCYICPQSSDLRSPVWSGIGGVDSLSRIQNFRHLLSGICNHQTLTRWVPDFTPFYLKQPSPKLVNPLPLKLKNVYLRAFAWWEHLFGAGHRRFWSAFNLWLLSGRRVGQPGLAPEPEVMFIVGSNVTLRDIW